MITALIILSALPLYQMALLKQTEVVDNVSCFFSITYTPDSGPVDLRKSKIACKKTKLISDNPTQPCNFTLTFKVSRKGKFQKASVVCVPPNTISLPPSPTPSPSPSPSPAPAMNEELAKMDAALGSPVTISCYQCLRENAPQCISLCFPFPWIKPECISCIVMFAPQCLGPCGFPSAADKYDKILDNTCEAVPEFDPFRCVVTKDNCDPGFVPVPLPIIGIRFGCACKCEPVPE